MPREEDVLDRGLRLFEAGDLSGAEACLSQVEGDPGRRAQALLALGRIFIKTDRAQQAESHLLQSLALRRTAETYLLLGESLLNQNKLPQAEAAFQEAMRRDPRGPEPCLMLGHALAAQDRLPEAIRHYEQALLRDATSPSARYYLAEALVQQGDLPRAATQLHYLLQREPNYVPAILLMGDMAFYQGDYRQAIVEYCRALALEPLDGPVYERLGQAFNAISDFAQALKAFESSIKEQPTYWPCYLEAARLCEGGKWLRKARRYYQAIAFMPEYREEAGAALARIEAHFAQFDLSEPDTDAPSASEAPDFRPPEIMTEAPARKTGPLDQRVILPAPPPPKFEVFDGPIPSSSSGTTGKLAGWVQSKTDKLADSVKEALPTDAVTDAGRKLLSKTGDLLPEGLKGFFKRPER